MSIKKKKKNLKLERLQRFVLFCFVCKAELKRFWVGLDSGTK